jgi:hypothetical protein
VVFNRGTPAFKLEEGGVMAKRKAAEVGELWIRSIAGEQEGFLILGVEKKHREIGLDYYSYTVLEPMTGQTFTFDKIFPIRESYTAGTRWKRAD